VLLFGLAALAPLALARQADTAFTAGLRWRPVGPNRAGRVSAVAGVPGDPTVYYIGTPDGGLWKTTDAGTTWQPIFDAVHAPSIGAVAVAPSDAHIVYVGTGEATSEPAEPTTDAILAIELATGAIRWHFQGTKDDIFLTGCLSNRAGLNCPKYGVFLDADFGASVVLVHRPGGHDILLAGQKSSTLYALDPDTGKLIWSRNFGPGSIAGGIHWGLAYDGTRVFTPVSVLPGRDGKPGPGQIAALHAVNVDTGKVEWSFIAQADCGGDRPTRVRNCAGGIGLSGAATVVDGAVVAGSLDGFLRAFDAKTGELLFQYDTTRDFDTVNGVPGKGGAIDNASIVAANGYVFVNSGYGLMAGQTPGNAFLAFHVQGGTTTP